jgi:hypothetical protein
MVGLAITLDPPYGYGICLNGDRPTKKSRASMMDCAGFFVPSLDR